MERKEKRRGRSWKGEGISTYAKLPENVPGEEGKVVEVEITKLGKVQSGITFRSPRNKVRIKGAGRLEMMFD